MKLYEIPVYSLTREKLAESINRKERELDNYSLSGESLQIVKEGVTLPYKYYDYNHICGMITIVYERNDFHFKVYKDCKKRHLWNSSRKNFLIDTYANGLHCNIQKSMTNEEIASVLSKKVKYIRKAFFPRYHMDLETFETMNNACDYNKIIRNIQS